MKSGRRTIAHLHAQVVHEVRTWLVELPRVIPISPVPAQPQFLLGVPAQPRRVPLGAGLLARRQGVPPQRLARRLCAQPLPLVAAVQPQVQIGVALRRVPVDAEQLLRTLTAPDDAD